LDCIRKDVLKQSINERYFPTTPAIGIICFMANTYGKYYGGDFNIENKTIFITEDFTNTINFLKLKKLYDYLSFNGEIESLEILQYKLNSKDKYINRMSKYFRSFNTQHGLALNYSNREISITDKAKIEVLIPKLQSNYFRNYDGYLVGITIKGQREHVYKYLPEKDAPEFLRRWLLIN
jgi:hypothetical protein